MAKLNPGNVLNIEPDTDTWLVHQVSRDYHGAAQGVAKDIFEKWPETDFYKHANEESRKEGTCWRVKHIVNLIGQKYIGKAKTALEHYERTVWFQHAMYELTDAVEKSAKTATPVKKIVFPFGIGCGLAGGEWPVYKNMIDGFAFKCKLVNVEIWEYGVPGVSIIVTGNKNPRLYNFAANKLDQVHYNALNNRTPETNKAELHLLLKFLEKIEYVEQTDAKIKPMHPWNLFCIFYE